MENIYLRSLINENLTFDLTDNILNHLIATALFKPLFVGLLE